jgi:anti-anti-sigma factor
MKSLKSVNINRPDEKLASYAILKWIYDECTYESGNAFLRLTILAELKNARLVVLDMSMCSYLSISGLHHLLQWSNELYEKGMELKISGLSEIQSRIFPLSGLEGMLMI